MRVALFLVAAAIILVPGCVGDAPVLVVTGTGGFLSTSYAYDGNGTDTALSMRVQVDPRTATGVVVAQWREDGHTYTVDWRDFAPRANGSYQANGIVGDLEAHGSTGHGDNLLPKVRYLSAGWGEGQVRRGDQVLNDPTTGDDTFAMHYMFLRDAVRDPITHKIFARDGKALYSPDQPDDAMVLTNDRELLLTIKSIGPQVAETWNRNATSVSTSPTSVSSTMTRARMHVPPHADLLRVWVNVTAPLMTGQIQIRLKDPTGAVAATTSLDQGRRYVMVNIPDPTPGIWLLDSTEQSPSTQYRITWHSHVPPLEPWFRMLTFESPSVQRGPSVRAAPESS